MWRKSEADNVAAFTEHLSTSLRQATFAYPSNQGPVAGSMIGANHWLRGIERRREETTGQPFRGRFLNSNSLNIESWRMSAH